MGLDSLGESTEPSVRARLRPVRPFQIACCVLEHDLCQARIDRRTVDKSLRGGYLQLSCRSLRPCDCSQRRHPFRRTKPRFDGGALATP